MGKVHTPIPVKLFVGMLYQDVGLFKTCGERLIGVYGPVDMQSDVLPWDHSDYYRGEMGANLQKVFIFFERLIDPGELAAIKHFTLRLEQEFALTDASRTHPGYITEAKVVLATTKDFPHRVYIGGSIYAESTLHYSKKSGAYLAVEHTYPDFRSLSCRDLFNKAREILRTRLHSG
jgi:hypothetical protein